MQQSRSDGDSKANMGHKPFYLQQVIPPIQGIKSIESLAVWTNTVFIGTNDGTLLNYEITYERPENAAQNTTLFKSDLKVKKSISKKGVTQLCAVPELSILISLSDGVIRLHTLRYINEMDKGLRNDKGVMKNCTMFALKKHHSEYSLAIAFKKKTISILTWQNDSFKWVQDLTMPDVVKSLTWADEELLVGFKREYCLVYVSQGKSPTSLFGTGNTQECDCKVLPNELLVSQGEIYVSLSFNGKANRSGAFYWREPPTCIGYLNPYLVGALPSFLEVKLLTKNHVTPMVQAIPLDGVTCMSQSNFINLDEKLIDEGQGVGYQTAKVDTDDPVIPDFRLFLGAKCGVYILCMNQFFSQAMELQEKGRFKQALRLCEIVDGTKYEVERWRVHRIHMKFGYHLFAKGEYEKAMMQFNDTDSDPRLVIALYGDIFPCNSRTEQLSLAEVNRQSLKQLEDPEKKREALNALIQYLTCRRIPAQKVALGDEEVIGETIDTCLLITLLLNDDEYMTQLIENENRCNIEDSELALQKSRKYKELILFYKTKQQHEKALVLLQAHGQKTHPDKNYKELDGVLPTIEYLRSLEDHKDLVKRFSTWVLKADPVKSLEIFTNDDDDRFEIDDIIELFESIEEGQVLTLKIGYLEWKIHEKESTDADLHNMLILLYLNYIQTNAEERESRSNEEINQRLITMLKTSEYYHPERMLSKFPSDSLFLERAILLGKIDRHDQALTYYIHKLNRPDLAEEYCIERCNVNSIASKDIFITALELFLQLPDGTGLKHAIQLLQRHFDKVDIIKVLQLLPDDVPLYNLEIYIRELLRDHVQMRRRMLVMKNLAKSENLQLKEQYILERQRSVKIKMNKTCPTCKKAIGNSAFALDPNGVVTHFVCHFQNPNGR